MSDSTDQQVAACWDLNADQWTEDVRAGFDVYRDQFTFPAFLNFLPDIRGLKLIDFGCGEGTNTRALARRGAHMTGLDLSARLVAHARQMEEEEPLGITYVANSYSTHCGLEDGSFDGVISTLALMDGPDFDGAMREAYRLVRPSGFICFSILHPCFIAPSIGWVRDEQEQAHQLCVSRYFDRSHFTEHWRFGSRAQDVEITPFAVPRFPRTVSDYLNGIIAAGWNIRQIEEPRPTDEACATTPRFARWRDIAAFLLMIRAEHP
ncbi:MAG: class I SAM-dependent methyltransferase [Xanthobacter sp.]